MVNFCNLTDLLQRADQTGETDRFTFLPMVLSFRVTVSWPTYSHWFSRTAALFGDTLSYFVSFPMIHDQLVVFLLWYVAITAVVLCYI